MDNLKAVIEHKQKQIGVLMRKVKELENGFLINNIINICILDDIDRLKVEIVSLNMEIDDKGAKLYMASLRVEELETKLMEHDKELELLKEQLKTPSFTATELDQMMGDLGFI